MSKPMIPSMGGRELGPVFNRYIETMPFGLDVVEVGTWLGAGTYELASALQEHGHTYSAGGLRRSSILYTYDWFIATKQTVSKAAGKHKYDPRIAVDGKGECLKLKAGIDTLPIVRKYLYPFPFVKFIKGDIAKIKYTGGDIGMLVVDSAKRKGLFLKVMQTLEPKLAPGAIVIFMDYWFSLYKRGTGTEYQAEYVKRSGRYEHLESHKNLCAEVVRYVGRSN